MRTPALVVLAAGEGRRFGGCKQLVPVGPRGETLMDYTLDRAFRAGFERAVVVIRPDLDGAFRDHLAPLVRSSAVALAHQPPGTAGTVPAVLAARRYLDDGAPFAVVNADDLYPASAIGALLEGPAVGHAVLGFRLAATIAPGSGPVNRALCRCEDGGHLLGLTETNIAHDGRGGFTARERGASPDVTVPGDQLVSMNAWRFQPSIWARLEAAMGGAPGAPEGEVLLPVVVGALIAQGEATVSVVPVAGSCIGLTWPGELATVRDMVGRMVAAGELPARVMLDGAPE
jgi:MobA-like NTP transferase domain